MRTLYVVVAVALCVGCVVAEEAAKESKVEILTDANFEEKTKEGLWLIKFYAPWCGHCKRLAPIWEELAEKANGAFHVAKMDCTVETKYKTKFGIRGFPTIKLIPNGDAPEDVSVPRTVEAYMGYMSRFNPVVDKAEAVEEKVEKIEETKPEVKEGVPSLSAETFEMELSKKALIVKFFAPWCGHCKHLAPTWEEFSAVSKKENKPYLVAEVDCTKNDILCQKYDVRGYPTIMFFNKGEHGVEYEGERKVESFVSWADGRIPSEHSEL